MTGITKAIEQIRSIESESLSDIETSKVHADNLLQKTRDEIEELIEKRINEAIQEVEDLHSEMVLKSAIEKTKSEDQAQVDAMRIRTRVEKNIPLVITHIRKIIIGEGNVLSESDE